MLDGLDVEPLQAGRRIYNAHEEEVPKNRADVACCSGLLSAGQDGINFCIVSISSCKLIGF